jgi:hypothetical protein
MAGGVLTTPFQLRHLRPHISIKSYELAGSIPKTSTMYQLPSFEQKTTYAHVTDHANDSYISIGMCKHRYELLDAAIDFSSGS